MDSFELNWALFRELREPDVEELLHPGEVKTQVSGLRGKGAHGLKVPPRVQVLLTQNPGYNYHHKSLRYT